MNKNILFLATPIAIVVLVVAWYLLSPLFIQLEESNEELVLPNPTTGQHLPQETNIPSSVAETDLPEQNPQQQSPIFSGNFERIDYNAEGSFDIYRTGNSHLLRIENLKTGNGPDLYLVFSNERSSSIKDFTILEKLTKQGSFNVEIPADVNPADYKYLHIHCVRFRHTFSGGEIKSVA